LQSGERTVGKGGDFKKGGGWGEVLRLLREKAGGEMHLQLTEWLLARSRGGRGKGRTVVESGVEGQKNVRDFRHLSKQEKKGERKSIRKGQYGKKRSVRKGFAQPITRGAPNDPKRAIQGKPSRQPKNRRQAKNEWNPIQELPRRIGKKVWGVHREMSVKKARKEV